jgi:putative ABC transport system substrate-binding protein
MTGCSVTRRGFLTATGAGALAFGLTPRGVEAQARPARVGVIFSRGRTSKDIQAFFEELKRLGFEEEKNLKVEYMEGPVSKFGDFANELVQRNVDAIFAPNTVAAVAARKVTASIPIVFATAHDPVEIGLVQTLAKPGGNVTGMTVFASEIPGKRLELFRELIPNLTRIAVLRSPLNEQNRPAWHALSEVAQRANIHLEPFDLRSPPELAAVFQAIRAARLPGVLIHEDGFIVSQWPRIAAAAIEARLPTNSAWDAAAEVGMLLSYGPPIVANYRKAAGYMASILKGAKPADLPVEQPTRFELVINAKTAKAINISIPPALLFRVDRLIE